MNANAKESRPVATGGHQKDAVNRAVNKASRSSIARRRRRAKYRRRRIALLLVVAIVLISIVALTAGRNREPAEPPATETAAPASTAIPSATPAPTPAPTPAADPTPPPARYDLTEAERDIVERTVMAEAGGEPFAGQVAVAQCILTACEKDGIRPDEALVKYQYAKNRPDPKGTVADAVAAVFDHGWYAATEPIMYFYAPARTTSKWHESQIFVLEINGHRFFAEKGAGK